MPTQWLLPNLVAPLFLLVSLGSGIKVGMIGDSGDRVEAQRAFKMMRDAGVDLVLDNGDLDYRNDPGRWSNFLREHWYAGSKSRGFLAVSGDHETLDDGDGRWDIGGDDTYRIRLWRSLSEDSNLGLESKCRGRDNRSLQDEFGKFTTCEIDNVFIAMVGWDEHQSMQKEELNFLRDRFAKTNAKWRICMWHRPEGAYQGRGGEDQDQGRLEVYDVCRQGGAVIYTGHAHNYHRSALMSSFKQKIISSRHRDTQLALSCGSDGASFAVNTGIGGRSMTGENFRFKHTVEEFSGNRARALGIDSGSRGAVICDLARDPAPCSLSVIEPSGNVHTADQWTMTTTCTSNTPTSPTTPSPTLRPTPRPSQRPTSSSPTPKPTPRPSGRPTDQLTNPPTLSVTRDPSLVVKTVLPTCNQGDGVYATNSQGGWIRPREKFIYLQTPRELATMTKVWITVTYLHPSTRASLPTFSVQHNSNDIEQPVNSLPALTEKIDDPPPPQGDFRYKAYIPLNNARFQKELTCQADLRLVDVQGMRIETIVMTNAPLPNNNAPDTETPEDREEPNPNKSASSPSLNVPFILGSAVGISALAALALVFVRNKRRTGANRTQPITAITLAKSY